MLIETVCDFALFGFFPVIEYCTEVCTVCGLPEMVPVAASIVSPDGKLGEIVNCNGPPVMLGLSIGNAELTGNEVSELGYAISTGVPLTRIERSMSARPPLPLKALMV